MPAVSLLLEPEQSDLQTGGTITVSFLLTASVAASPTAAWDEDDSLSVVVHRPDSSSTSSSVSNIQAGLSSDNCMYLAREQTSEAFEYTSRPDAVPVDRHQQTLQRFGQLSALDSECKPERFTGSCQLTLPSYGGVYHVSYVRTITHTVEQRDPATGNTSVEYKRIPVTIAQSAPFVVRSPVYFHHPDKRPSSSTRQKVMRRRGAGDVAAKRASMDILVEDMMNIHTVNVTGTLSNSSERDRQSVARVMAWMFDAGDSTDNSASVELLLELDVVTLPDSASGDGLGPVCAESVRTVYHSATISNCGFSGLGDIVWDSAWSEAGSTGTITVRFTYKPSDSPKTASPYEERSGAPLSIHCGFCDHSLLPQPSSLTDIRPMPTGMFDNVSLLLL